MNGLHLSDRRRRSPSASAPTALLNSLRGLWLIVLVWCEIGRFLFSSFACSWPDKVITKGTSSERPAHVLLLADAKVRFPSQSRRFSLATLRQFMADLTLRRSWYAVTRKQPDIIFFLGDMLASGRAMMTDDEYDQYFYKFQSIFHMNRWVEPTSVYYIPGNNDVGLNISPSLSRNARRRFLKHFGAVNQEVSVRNHTFVMLDAAGFVDEDYQRTAQKLGYGEYAPVRGGSVEFINSFSQEHNILLTHIPLARPERASCGPLRDHGTIHRGVGPGYQNTLGKQTTAFLLEKVHPILIFSGDNRDYCEYTHIPPVDARYPDPVREVTVRSLSWVKDIERPGFHLLSVVTPPSSAIFSTTPVRTVADAPCTLPNQADIFSTTYIPLAIVSLILLFLYELILHRDDRRHFSAGSSRLSISPVPYSTPNHDYSSGSFPVSPYPSAPESAVWSPESPVTIHSPVPHHSRTPSSTRIYRASQSRNATPLHSRPGSPGHSKSSLMLEEDDMVLEMGSVLPDGFSRRDGGQLHDGDLGDDDKDSEYSHFLPAPASKPWPTEGRREYSWAFVCLGRTRRITLCRPRLNEIIPMTLALLTGKVWDEKNARMRRRKPSVVRATMMDAVGITWTVGMFGVVLLCFIDWMV
ncbi:hypothetical protein JAAARDRAFT_275020 [Jaapia argillacea MUCL 33604]|uniref:Calcineurin-like phosphoesterase domain-containing protein n=1 Tax=Jaapia argillacea MUCL 33604 TaxID=933084 RepID=A0A067Q5A1_9AGAM|nr:hypothetical protein JAAARDRAFT_275020 [Jaapia argillacea MUCL 33604]